MPASRSRRAAVAMALSLVLALSLGSAAAAVVGATADANAAAAEANAAASANATGLRDEAADDAQLFARMAGLVMSRGYPLEMAAVRTTDGHRSLVFRIPRGRDEQDEEDDEDKEEARPQGAPLLDLRRLQPNAGSPWPWARLRAWLLGRPLPPRRPRPRPTKPKPVVLLQHGLLGSSADFALNDPSESLALALADAGFDVFLANSRGNEYGRGGGAGGGPGSAYFWAFSYDEMAEFDLPAAVDHALAASGARSLYLVAFSQGTTAALASLALSGGSAGRRGLSPEKVELAVLMGPVAYAAHVASAPLRRLADLGTDQLLLLLGAREFSPSGELLRRLGGDLCLASPELCVSALTAICGYSRDKGDPRRIPLYLNYTPSGTSVQNVAHWAQAVRGRGGGGGGGGGGDGDDDASGGGGLRDGDGGGGCCGGGGGAGGGDDDDDGSGGGRLRDGGGGRRAGCFCAYDYGAQCETPLVRLPRPCNQRVYGRARPPEYDLREALRGGPPIVLVTGGRDRLADPRDAALLSAALEGAGVLRALHHEPTFEHLDFLWGVRELGGVYERVIGELRDHHLERQRAGAAAVAAPGFGPRVTAPGLYPRVAALRRR